MCTTIRHLCLPLSRIINNKHGQTVAARFELFANGCELANGYHELADGKEQESRFKRDQQDREMLGKPDYPYDQNLVEALNHGFPDCAGVAMGIDRLHMLMSGSKAIKDVVPFDYSRA